ncbi:MAG: SpoVR family protein [Myxococcota bacterium]|jgi:stage V sporulation protein R|nr:SpoVR family protein [Myxococcota bacterium]
MDLPSRLQELRDRIEGYARDFGLDFFPTHFEICDYKTINEIAAYGGFPTRYNHWRFGMEYEHLSKSYEFGLSKIYEMVINNDPAYAYLLEGNHLVDHKTVIAHVYAHVDFFKNNLFFAHTNRRMVDEMANHATRVRRYIDRFGIDLVEDFIETCLSIDNLIDPFSVYIREKRSEPPKEEVNELGLPKLSVSKEYLANYINPKEFLDAQRRKLEEDKERSKRFPERPERDVLQFIIDNAPLELWEADVLSTIREEAYYFAPQGQTKIMNEGWATYWHSRIMTEKALEASELLDYADAYSSVVASSPMRVNPYKIGVELWRDIVERWNSGRFGPEWERCDSLAERANWNRELGLGMQKIFEVRKLYNDVTFIDDFLTEDFCRKHQLFTFAYNQKDKEYQIQSREFAQIKQKMLFELTNFGQPFIYVKDGNYANRGELLLHHKFEGTPLRLDYAREVLSKLFKLWRRPVNIETVVDGKGKLFTFTGSDHRETSCSYEAL